MKLIGMLDSPYVRRAAISAKCLGITLELFEVAEHRDRLMFQRDSQAFGRNGGAPDIGRVQHTEQLHGPFLYMAISGGQP